MSVVAVSLKKKNECCSTNGYFAANEAIECAFGKSIPHSYFFFQAEDGIRDLYVTGVQTCALPIFERLEALLHRRQIVTLPDTAHPGGRDRQPAPLQRFGDPHLAPGRLLDRHLDRRLFDVDRGAVLQDRLSPADLLQRQLAAFVVQLLEPIEAVEIGRAHV